MKMLQRIYGLQTAPILEPDNPSLFQHIAECPIDKLVNLRLCRIIRRRAFFEVKFRPDDQVRDVLINTVRPVVEENFVVRRVCKMVVPRRGDRGPLQAFVLQEIQDRAICPFTIVDVLQVPSLFAWNALE